jgi:flavodoxin I
MYKNTIIIYGSSLGNTRFVAEKLQMLLPGAVLRDSVEVGPETISSFDRLILGTSTWGVGLLQDEYETFMEMLQEQDMEGKTVALFGLGDQQNYPDSFCDGMGKIYELLQNKGIKFIGAWPPDDYDFTTSKALIDEQLVGLALDEDNEPDLTDYRLKKWVEQIKTEL